MKLFKMVLVAGLVAAAVPAYANDIQYFQADDSVESEGTLIFDSEMLVPPPRRAPPRRDPPPRRRPPRPQPPPRAPIYECRAISVERPWNLYVGYRSYSYNQARYSALQQCEYYEASLCIVRSCYQF